uniref:Uncharacterized protein n=1 Tax=Arundo donax TaxID=35708 RepID=A0A0A9H044_ARUDO
MSPVPLITSINLSLLGASFMATCHQLISESPNLGNKGLLIKSTHLILESKECRSI